MAQQILIFPDGQRVNPALVARYLTLSTQIGWIYSAGGTDAFTGYGTNLANYKNLQRIVDIVIASGLDGFYDLAQLAGYSITSIAPATIHSGGVTASIVVLGTGFDSTMVGNDIWIEDIASSGEYDSNSTSFIIASVDSPTQLTATWFSDGDNASFNVPNFAYYQDANGMFYGNFTGVSIVNP